ncbi:MAG: hypothetical protein N3A69_13930, partial [Leptospiraceae bacterium]|nr:hypothetical protein [Leptospiraceae bacterium]
MKNLVFLVIFLAELAWHIQIIYSYFSLENYLGTLRSPHSDPLVPWLHGALVYYFDEFPIGYLFRPTIGLLYASFIT